MYKDVGMGVPKSIKNQGVWMAVRNKAGMMAYNVKLNVHSPSLQYGYMIIISIP